MVFCVYIQAFSSPLLARLVGGPLPLARVGSLETSSVSTFLVDYRFFMLILIDNSGFALLLVLTNT